jgi:hypothetical protein
VKSPEHQAGIPRATPCQRARQRRNSAVEEAAWQGHARPVGDLSANLGFAFGRLRGHAEGMATGPLAAVVVLIFACKASDHRFVQPTLREARFWDWKLGPAKGTLPVGAGRFGRTPHIALSGAFLASRASDCNGWPRRWGSGRTARLATRKNLPDSVQRCFRWNQALGQLRQERHVYRTRTPKSHPSSVRSGMARVECVATQGFLNVHLRAAPDGAWINQRRLQL